MEKILLIDDDQPTRRSLGRTLKRGGYKVMYAASGKDGITQAESQPPDLVISDVVMPDMEGLELLKWFKKKRPDLPVIIMTGYNSIYLKAAIKLGASYGLEKPFKDNELLSAVREVLKSHP